MGVVGGLEMRAVFWNIGFRLVLLAPSFSGRSGGGGIRSGMLYIFMRAPVSFFVLFV